MQTHNSKRDSVTGVFTNCFSYLPKFSVSGLTRYIRFLSVCSGCNRSKFTCYHGEKKSHDQLLEETCRHSCYFTSCLKNPYVHSPYLREAKVKDVGIQLLHCSREPVFAEILAAELAVGRPQTHVCTKQKAVTIHVLGDQHSVPWLPNKPWSKYLRSKHLLKLYNQLQSTQEIAFSPWETFTILSTSTACPSLTGSKRTGGVNHTQTQRSTVAKPFWFSF